MYLQIHQYKWLVLKYKSDQYSNKGKVGTGIHLHLAVLWLAQGNYTLAQRFVIMLKYNTMNIWLGKSITNRYLVTNHICA